MIHKWSGVPGEFEAEINYDRLAEAWTDDGCDEFSVELNRLLTATYEDYDDDGREQKLELVIEFTSSGYSDPGVSTGPNEGCYPPEHEDNRSPGDITINGKPVEDDDLRKLLWEHYEEKVQEIDIDEYHNDNLD